MRVPRSLLAAAIVTVSTLLGASTALAAPLAAPTQRASGTPCAASVAACVDLSSAQAWLVEGGRVSYGPVPITSGKRGYRTPPGTFAVTFKNKNHHSSIYDTPMPNAVFFNRGIAFHEGSLRQQSHGCIHLSGPASLRFYDTLAPGDRVQVVS